MSEIRVPLPLVLVVDEPELAESYADHVADCAWYAANDPDNGWPNEGYGANTPAPYEVYRQQIIDSIIAEIHGHEGWPWKLEKAEGPVAAGPSNAEPSRPRMRGKARSA